MSQRLQTWLLQNTKGLQYVVNQRLAKREGTIGDVFRLFQIGERQMGKHSLGSWVKVCNWFYFRMLQSISARRVVLSRLINVTSGPLNYTAFFSYVFATLYILSSFRFVRQRDVLKFNYQDQPEFWYARYNMMFPPSFLQNRLSAHYIEINHIFAIEMLKRYQGARREILQEREACTPEERLTRYASNPNYVYEPLGPDADGMLRFKSQGYF